MRDRILISAARTLVTALALMCPVGASAKEIQVRVSGVLDGETITARDARDVEMRIRLHAVAAPKKDQPWSEAARQHLSDLTLGKQVTIVPMGIENNYIVGRVYLNGVDIGQQMIRDGVAWHFKHYVDEQDKLSSRLYAECESAARSERRGLWQDPQPTPPWNFTPALKTQTAVGASSWPEALAAAKPAGPRPGHGLTSEDLRSYRNASPAGAVPAPPAPAAGARAGGAKGKMLAPGGEYFSVDVPGVGAQFGTQLPTPKGQVDAQFYMSRSGESAYMVIWATGPYEGETPAAIFDGTMANFKQGIKKFFDSRGQDFNCKVVNERELSLNGFTGRQYKVTGCEPGAVIRIYYKANGKRLKLYMFGAVNGDEGAPEARHFFESFHIDSERNSFID